MKTVERRDMIFVFCLVYDNASVVCGEDTAGERTTRK